MDDENLISWREIRRQRALNERRMEMYDRLMDAEARLEDIRGRRGVSDTALGDALEIAEAGDGQAGSEAGVYVSALARYIAELGGRLEVVAVVGEERVALPDVPV